MRKDKGKSGKFPNGEYKSTPPNVLSRDIKDYTILKVSRLDTTPNVKEGYLEFEGVVSSETQAGVKYRVMMRFHDLDFQPIQDESHTQEAQTIVKGKRVKVYFSTPTIRHNAVSMKCVCKDFRHRFSHQLADVDTLIGAPLPYDRKTPQWPEGNPYANATDKQGFCKHVHSMVEYLKSKSLIKE